MVEYLKAENHILRDRLPDKIVVTPSKKSSLLRYGAPPGAAIRELITVVHPPTFFRWLAGDRPATAKKAPTREPGRPRTAEDVRQLVLRLATETGWGSTRILGELKTLGVHGVCRSTVVNILKVAGLDPTPDRRRGTWRDFIRWHAATLWASDFVGVKTLSRKGLVDLYLLFLIHVDSRPVFVSGITAHPDKEWVTQEARNASMQFAEWALPYSRLLIDHDTKCVAGFEADGTEVKRVGPMAPTLNAYAEAGSKASAGNCLITSWRSARVICGTWCPSKSSTTTASLRTWGKSNIPLDHSPPSADPEADLESVLLPFPPRGDCHERLGGHLKHDRRAA